MKTLVSSLFVLISILGPVGSVALAAETDDESIEDISEIGPADVAPFVFNGELLGNPGWVASVLDSNSFICTGVMVHPQWVLTAAHCVDIPGFYTIRVGHTFWDNGQVRFVDEIRLHPGYSEAVDRSVDLAMVKLRSPINDQPVPTLATSPSWPVLDQTLAVMGWGSTYTNSPPSRQLQAAWVTVGSDSTGAVNESRCLREWVATSGYEDFCFGGDSWACSGDSGGPLVGFATPQMETGALDTIYGIVSYGQAAGCSDVIVDSVAQSVAHHVEWIKSFYTSGASTGDEMFFYRSTDGAFRYYDMKPNGTLGNLLQGGTGYSKGWDSITAIDLDGDGTDESFFYRSTDGAFRYYDMKPNGSLGNLLSGGTGYSKGWDSITAIDLNGDGRDEQFFYRSADGAYRYYQTKPNGSLGNLLQGGTGYSLGWDSITAIDLDGDGTDESFFYRSADGAYRYYQTKPNGSLGNLLQGGTGYSKGWDSITAIDLDGDGTDESFFYRSTDGAFRYYDMKPNGSLGNLLQGGTGYSLGWDSITAIDLGG